MHRRVNESFQPSQHSQSLAPIKRITVLGLCVRSHREFPSSGNLQRHMEACITVTGEVGAFALATPGSIERLGKHENAGARAKMNGVSL